METFERQQDLLAPEDLEGLDVDVVGAGALGGAVLMCLGKMGFGRSGRLTVTDFDRCEPHNVPNQWFRPGDAAAGRAKVDAVADTALWVLGMDVIAVDARFTGDETRALGPVVVLAVDTFAERAAIWRRLRGRTDVRLVVDVRAGAEVVEVQAVAVGRDDPAAYEAGLAEEPFEEACTRRAVFYGALGAAALAGSVIRAWVKGEPFPRRVTADLGNFWIDAAAVLP